MFVDSKQIFQSKIRDYKYPGYHQRDRSVHCSFFTSYLEKTTKIHTLQTGLNASNIFCLSVQAVNYFHVFSLQQLFDFCNTKTCDYRYEHIAFAIS